MDDTQLHQFYLSLIRRLRESGVLCAITSGLACVHYHIAETTKDCDLLCHDGAFDRLLAELSATQVAGLSCRYRGNISPPLDARWHRGGWTSHFIWPTPGEQVTLDVFGSSLRGSMRWETDLSGLYASPHVVAEMKRTNRDKDWPFITLLGEQLLAAGDPRGWLHLFDVDVLERLARVHAIPAEVVERRPCLRLAGQQDPKLRGALHAERLLWEELDRLRIEILRRALRPYVSAVGRARIPGDAPLSEQHAARLRCAENTLAKSPLVDYGLARYVGEARKATAELVNPDVLTWLPDVTMHFSFLTA